MTRKLLVDTPRRPSMMSRILLTSALSLAMLAAATLAQAQTNHFKIGGTGSALATMRLLADAYVGEYPETKITVLPSLGSGGGIKAVLSGAIEIALSARALKEHEDQAGAIAVEYARTPFVFATQARNTATGLNEPELIGMLSGENDLWPDGSRVRLILRPKGDSTSKIVKRISPAVQKAMTAAERRKGMPFAVTDQDAADKIETTPGALGTSTLAQITSEQRQIKALAWNGVEPTAGALAEGRYPFYKQLYFVTDAETPPAAQGFLDYLRSQTGREILEANGHWVQ